MSRSFCDLPIQNQFVETMPGVQEITLGAQQTLGVSYSRVLPTPVARPEMLIWSDDASRILAVQKDKFNENELTAIFAGNKVCPAMKPYAARYGGHQFGQWAGQLGDGRAITLCELMSEAAQPWEIQLKGAGLTPYSRTADGRAVLRSSLREFFCSEAMFYLGVPTTRALCCVTTGEAVVRDMFYDGNPEAEPGAITTRIAPSFIRFGNFQIYAAYGETELLKKFTDYVITQFFPEIDDRSSDKYLEMFSQVVKSTARLMVEWLRVGFVHGVMNTDNMSILGLTIDYGPFGWQDVYDPDWTPNTTDFSRRRYRFGAQPTVAMWNLARLGEAIAPLLTKPEALQSVLDTYWDYFHRAYVEMMNNKLGLPTDSSESRLKLFETLHETLTLSPVDMTIFYRSLAQVRGEDQSEKQAWAIVVEAYYEQNPSDQARVKMQSWLAQYQQILRAEAIDFQKRVATMNRTNPYFIPRNYILQQCIDEVSAGKTELLNDISQAMKTPFEENIFTKKFFIRRPDWAKDKPGCATLSCSS